jgi:hypothetical protein
MEVVIRVPPARSYNAGRAGLADGAGYPARIWGAGLVSEHRTKFRKVASPSQRREDPSVLSVYFF